MSANRAGDSEKLVDEELDRIRKTSNLRANGLVSELIKSGKLFLTIQKSARAEAIFRECTGLIEGKPGDANSPVVNGLLGESLVRQIADTAPAGPRKRASKAPIFASALTITRSVLVAIIK